ncbi:MAG: methylated-DNA--[protein]-cysteine S-methyltransferase [Bacteroidetes bacterium]|nr:MAG: methylated-DNA--[protein]-cysteine S-methyltransferase [Bacteroidota bacterium]
MSIFANFYESPIGFLEIKGNESHILSIFFVEKEALNTSLPSNEIVEKAVTQLAEYFNHQRKTFDFAIDPQGTDFQKKVWQELAKIPFGKTTTYLQMSKNLQNVKAIRAVGTSNGKNPLTIVLPCHRVVGSDGSLTGYAGGLWRKKWLLDFEQNQLETALF